MTLLTVSEVRGAIAVGLGDVDLQDLIAREEAWLARRIGPLSGTRTQTFRVRVLYPDPLLQRVQWLGERGPEPEPLLLQRYTDAVEVTDDGSPVDVSLLRGGSAMVREDGHPWTGPMVTAAYTPNDAMEVRRALIELVRMSLAASPFASESVGDHSYQRGDRDHRMAIVRDLLPHRGPMTTRLRSGLAVS